MKVDENVDWDVVRSVGDKIIIWNDGGLYCDVGAELGSGNDEGIIL